MEEVQQQQQYNNNEPKCRAALRRARRVCVKAGTSVVANDHGGPSLTRLAALTEQISELVNDGVQVILVSSGAVGMGKRLLRKQSKMLMSLKDIQQNEPTSLMSGMSDHHHHHHHHQRIVTSNRQSFQSLLELSERPHTLQTKKKVYDSACAAAGQFEMMNLYSSLFAQCDITASQILVTQNDFLEQKRLQNLCYAMERLLSLGIVPIINENDAVSANLGYTEDDVFSDNDSLAALCARHFHAEVLLLLTDVNGVYDLPPTNPKSKLIPYYNEKFFKDKISIGEKSLHGRGGMSSKIDAALKSVSIGSRCSACIVAAGKDLDIIRTTLGSNKNGGTTTESTTTKPKGTLFCTPDSDLESQAIKDYFSENGSNGTASITKNGSGGGSESTSNNGNGDSSTGVENSSEAYEKAIKARTQARKLQSLSYDVRQNILRTISKALIDRQDELLEANAKDLKACENNNDITPQLKKRLKLTKEKIQTLATGLQQISDLDDPLNVVKNKREISKDLILSQITVPIGVLLIIFESRPDSMPQIASLSLASGNGLLLKGGKEAIHSNTAIHNVIGDAIEAGSSNQITRDIIGLITTRSEIKNLLQLDNVIDLVIPRGSNALVQYIKTNTKIPVLGHADGVCHVYVDVSAKNSTKVSELVVDAKTNYPSACNAMETLLLHHGTIETGIANQVLMALRSSGVKCLGGLQALKIGLCDTPAIEYKYEYGDLTCMVEVVNNMDDAIQHIHKYGSGHTECMICGDNEVSTIGEEFLKCIDSACVFVNASTRFSDGYRFGLGAEVGISTTRIHARGPVGVEGLLTTKYQLRAMSGTSHTVTEYSGMDATKTYTHKELM